MNLNAAMETCKPSDHVPVELTLQLPVQTSQSTPKLFTNPPTIPLSSKNIHSYSESDSESSGLRLHSLSGLVQTAISFDSTSKEQVHTENSTAEPQIEENKEDVQQEDSKK